MKRIIFSIGLMLLTSLVGNAQTNQGLQIVLHLTGADDEVLNGGMPKAPHRPMCIYLSSGTLLFPQPFNEAVSIELYDADGIVVFSTCVPAGSTTLSLPTSLSGDYTLLLYIGNSCYCGIIHL